jgi:hypothetical protein
MDFQKKEFRMPAMIQRHLRLTVFLMAAGAWFDPQSVPAQEGLTAVATNVWSAPTTKLQETSRRSVRHSWKDKPPIPVKTPGFIPLHSAGNKSGFLNGSNSRNQAAHQIHPVGPPYHPVFGTKPVNGALPVTVLAPRNQPFTSLYHDPTP